jgi:acyl-CoA thioesterase-1
MPHLAALLLLVHLASACSGGERDAQPADPPANTAAASPAPEPALAPDTRLVIAFGDSLYAGYGLTQDQGFAPALRRALQARGIKAQVVNAGVSGDTSAGGLARLAFTLDGQPRKPDLVIVGLGANDMLRGLSPDATRTNLDAILTELKRRNIPAMLTGMVAAPNMGADYAGAFNPIYPELANRFALPLYPFFLDGVTGHADLQLPDAMHPNDKGVVLVAGKVAPVVVAALGK